MTIDRKKLGQDLNRHLEQLVNGATLEELQAVWDLLDIWRVFVEEVMAERDSGIR